MRVSIRQTVFTGVTRSMPHVLHADKDFFQADHLPRICVRSGRKHNIELRTIYAPVHQAHGDDTEPVLRNSLLMIGIPIFSTGEFPGRNIQLPFNHEVYWEWSFRKHAWWILLSLMIPTSFVGIWMFQETLPGKIALSLIGIALLLSAVVAWWGNRSPFRISTIGPSAIEIQFPDNRFGVYMAYKQAYADWLFVSSETASAWPATVGAGKIEAPDIPLNDCTVWDEGRKVDV